MNKLFTKNCGFLTSFINYPPLNIFFYQPLSSQTDIGINPICVKYQNLCLVYGTKKCCTSSNLASVQIWSLFSSAGTQKHWLKF